MGRPLGFPCPARSTDTFRWRLYYDVVGPGVSSDFLGAGMISTADAHSALTGPPAPALVAPGQVLNSQSVVALTMTGDIFSAAPTVAFNFGGQPARWPPSAGPSSGSTIRR